MSAEFIGYAALGLALLAMTSRRLTRLRALHVASCVLYALYGIAVGATPVLVGAILFAGIHIYRLVTAPKLQEGN